MYALNLTHSLVPAQADEDIRPTTVGGVLREAAARSPQSIMLVEADGTGATGRSWTCTELLADAERLAEALLTRYAPGERVAVWAPNVPEWVIAEFALALAGLTLVTVNPGYRARELAYVLDQSKAAGLLLIAEHRGNPMRQIADEVGRERPAVREIVDLEDAAALFRLAGEPPPLPNVDPRGEVQIQYTSGTTGFPKGVVLSHIALTNNARHYFTAAGIAPGSTTLTMMPLFHTAGCAMAVLGAVQHGCRMVLLRQFEPGAALDLIEAEGIGQLLGVPTMLIAAVEAQKARPRDVGSLTVAGCGGSMVSSELIRDVTQTFGCGFFTVYGQTETSPLLTMTRPSDAWEDICTTIGQPVAQTELAIMATGGGGPVPVGEVGEICARAYSVMLGYNDDPEATARAIDADGWLHTGDLGTMDARGYVRITGRLKEMIIRGGENLFPAEIENVLLEHPDVAEVAIVGVPDARLGEAVAAFVRPAAGAALDPAALIAHCRANLAAQKTPAHWIAVDEWPLTGSGKIQKFALRDRFVAGALGMDDSQERP